MFSIVPRKPSHTEQVQLTAVSPPRCIASNTARLQRLMTRPSMMIELPCSSLDSLTVLRSPAQVPTVSWWICRMRVRGALPGMVSFGPSNRSRTSDGDHVRNGAAVPRSVGREHPPQLVAVPRFACSASMSRMRAFHGVRLSATMGSGKLLVAGERRARGRYPPGSTGPAPRPCSWARSIAVIWPFVLRPGAKPATTIPSRPGRDVGVDVDSVRSPRTRGLTSTRGSSPADPRPGRRTRCPAPGGGPDGGRC